LQPLQITLFRWICYQTNFHLVTSNYTSPLNTLEVLTSPTRGATAFQHIGRGTIHHPKPPHLNRTLFRCSEGRRLIRVHFQQFTLRKLCFNFFSHWMGYDRGDSRPFDFEPNRIPFGSENRKENCHHNHIPFNVKRNGNIVSQFKVQLASHYAERRASLRWPASIFFQFGIDSETRIRLGHFLCRPRSISRKLVFKY